MPLPVASSQVVAVLSATSGLQSSVSPVAGNQYDSHSLLDGRREVLIQHGAETYCLRHTRNDKLILTK